MKKNNQKSKKSSEKKNQKKKSFKPNKPKSFKKNSSNSKVKNKPNIKHDKEKKTKSSIKVVKVDNKKESKLEYKKRLNRLYASLLMNHNDQSKSLESINSLLKELPPNLCQASNKRNISRILQACLKYGGVKERSSIFQKVQQNFNILNLNSHSSKFFIKLFHYCNVDVKEFLRTSFFNEKQKNLLFSRYGSDVMDVMYIKLKSKDQISVLKLYCLSNSFFLNKEDMRQSTQINSINQLIDLILNSHSKRSCLEKMCSVVTKLVEKELLVSSLSHDILYIYLHILEDNKPVSASMNPDDVGNGSAAGESDKMDTDGLDGDEEDSDTDKSADNDATVKENVGESSDKKKEPINSKLELFTQMYKIYGQLLSSRSGNNCMIMLMDYANNKIKKHIVKSLKRDFPGAVFNQINVALLIKVINVTDDTKLTTECLINPLLSDLKTVVYDKNASKFVMNIVDNPNEKAPNCLKDPELRTQELQSKLVPGLVELFKGEDLRQLMETNHTAPILLHTLKLSKDAELVDSILNLFEANVADFLGNTATLRFIQSLVKSSNRVSGALVDLRVSELIWNLVKDDIDGILKSKSVFLLVDLLESFNKYHEKKLVSEFKSKVTENRISKARTEIKGDNFVGLDLLSSLLTK